MAEGDSGRRGRSVALAIIMGVALVLLAIWMFYFQIDFNPFWDSATEKMTAVGIAFLPLPAVLRALPARRCGALGGSIDAEER